MENSPCESCRYYNQGKTWNIAPYKTLNESGEGLILIVDSHPNKLEDNKGLVFDSYGKCSKEFRKLLNCLDSPYAIASSLGCYPVVNGKETKPSDKEVRNCADTYLHGIIKDLKPRVIVCLGPLAMKAVLGSRAPKVMEPILNSPVKLSDNDDSPDVIVTNHPAIYWKKDKEYQMKIHLDVLALADDLARGITKKTKIPFTEITSSRELKKILPSLNKKLYFDIENTGNKYDKDRATIWHKGSKLLCFSITDVHFTERRQFVIHGPVLANKELLIELFQNRVVVGHNVHYDIQAFYAFTGIDLYEICEGFECTFAALYLSNQNKIGNSLKKRACDLGAVDWAVPVRQAIQDHKQLISSLHKYINSERGKIYRIFKAGKATPFDIIRYRELTNHKLYTRPLNSQDYGDVPSSILYPYNAEDTYQTAEIDEKTVQPMWKNGEISKEAYELVKKEMVLIAYIERNGLNIDVNRLKALKEVAEIRLKEYQNILLSNDTILEAIYDSNPEIVNELRKSPGKARLILKKAISPKGKKFFDSLAKLTGVEHLAFASIKKKKKTDSLCFDIDALLRICGGLPDTEENQKDEYWVSWEDKTEVQKLWFVILQYRKLFDLRTRFIKDVEFYQLDGKVRTTFVLFKTEAFSSGSIGKEGGGGAGTGRLSSRNFNFQNLKKDPILRWIFAAGENFLYTEFDYKSIEPRIMALVSGCKKFKEAFDRGLDLYQVIANEVYNLGVDLTLPDEIVRDELNRVCPKNGETRGIAKTSTLAIMYGESVRGFAARSGLNEEDVAVFFKNFDRMFPEISTLREQTRQQLLSGLPIISLFGRTKIYELPSRGDEKYSMKMASILRQAFNFLIQSVANDILLLRAHAVMRWIRSKGEEFQKNVAIVNIIHDSIVLRIHKDYLWVRAEIKKILEDMSDVGLNIDISIEVDEKTAEDLAGNLK